MWCREDACLLDLKILRLRLNNLQRMRVMEEAEWALQATVSGRTGASESYE